jgi:EpsD family peptidyl-prolyl cis-trans isomerase
MKLGSIGLLGAVACLALTGCSDKPKEPKGQVIATVGKEEITAIDLRNEMGSVSIPDPKMRRAVEQRALDSIITRKWLAQAAEKAKIDKTPEYAQQKARLEEALLVQTWQNKIAKMVPPPTSEEANAFMQQHPEMYAQRQIFVAEQLRMVRPANNQVLEAMRPLNTMEQVEQFLTANRIPYQKGEFRFDAVQIGPQLTAQINKLPPNEVFVIPSGNLLLVNRLKETVVVPFTGQQATQHALNYLRSTRTQEAIRRQFGSVMQGAKEQVKYSKAYQPAPPQKAAAQPKPAAAPAAAAPAAAAPAAAAPAPAAAAPAPAAAAPATAP